MSTSQTEASSEELNKQEKLLAMTTSKSIRTWIYSIFILAILSFFKPANHWCRFSVNYKDLSERRRTRSVELLKENDSLLEEVAHYQSINESLNETKEEIESELEDLVSQRNSLNSLIMEAKDITEALTVGQSVSF